MGRGWGSPALRLLGMLHGGKCKLQPRMHRKGRMGGGGLAEICGVGDTCEGVCPWDVSAGTQRAGGVHGAPKPPLQEPSEASSFCFPIQSTSSGRNYPGEAARRTPPLCPLLAFSLLTSTPGKKAAITQELTDPRYTLQPHTSSPGRAAPPTTLHPLLFTHGSACPPSASRQQTPSPLCLSSLPRAARAPPCSGSGGS